GEHLLEEGPFHRSFQIDEWGEEMVSARMSPAVQTVRMDVSVMQAARDMCAEHIHRLIVLDETGRVAGVATTLDFMAAVLNAVDEAEAR
ncbi:MAG: CBS domain-containing protein, partial [Planctomycetales bacterium]